jgi:hypothetical protein
MTRFEGVIVCNHMVEHSGVKGEDQGRRACGHNIEDFGSLIRRLLGFLVERERRQQYQFLMVALREVSR